MTSSFRPTRRAFVAIAGLCLAPAATRAAEPVLVVFVCEHGVAKSVVAAEHFNGLARARGIAAVAVSRGVAPEDRVPNGVRAGLASDGIDVSGFVPRRLSAEDVRRARRIVIIGAKADLGGRSAGVERWDDVPAVSEDYARARGRIVAHVEDLLARMEK